MNREQRRKNGISKETSDKLDNLKQPCTILECIQLSQGVADDAIKNYHESINPIIVSLSIQIEVLKEMLFNSDTPVIKEEEFIEKFNKRVEDYNSQKEEALKAIKDNIMNYQEASSEGIPSTDVAPSDVDLKIVK